MAVKSPNPLRGQGAQSGLKKESDGPEVKA